MAVGKAVVIGMLVMLAGTIPRNILFAANLRYFTSIPWAVPLTAVYLWFFWQYLNGAGQPDTTAAYRRAGLRANLVPAQVWVWALLAGGLGIIALVLALQVSNRLTVLPSQRLPDLTGIPRITILSLLLMGAPVAGIVEEAAFRGYMQGPIERQHGLAVGILITGTMFAIAHLDFTPVLWPYYVAVAALYGTVTFSTQSILPAVVLHTAGNLYSNLDLWLHGHAEWQAPPAPQALVWATGTDTSFWISTLNFTVFAAATGLAYWQLARITRTLRPTRDL